MHVPSTPRRIAIGAMAALALITVVASGGIHIASARGGEHGGAPKPTIVLVHGAFADAAGWAGVTERLQDRGYTVIAPANPLRSLAGDSAYIGSLLDTVEGPVVLVGHSYGGAVITNAAATRDNVQALVYIAAFAPDAGDTLAELIAMNPGSKLGGPALVVRPYPGGHDGYVNPTNFREIFAGDLDRDTAAMLAATQRPSEVEILDEQSGAPGWQTIPSWYMVATRDNLIPAETQRFMAERAGATTVEVRSSHVAMISHAKATTDLILSAANSLN